MGQKYNAGYFEFECKIYDGSNPGQTDKAMRYCLSWGKMYRDNIGLILWGNVGTGKTYFAACIANYLINLGVPVLMTSFIKLTNVSPYTGEWIEMYTICQPTVNQLSTECQHRLGKDSIGKVNNIADKPQKFKPPNLEEVTAYCKERNNSVNPQQFIDHYTANGWYRGKTKIKDWRACVRTWEKNTRQQGKADVFDEARKILEAEQNDGQ